MEIGDFITPALSVLVLNEDSDGSFLKRLSIHVAQQQEELKAKELHESGEIDCNTSINRTNSLDIRNPIKPFHKANAAKEAKESFADSLTSDQCLTLVPEDIPVQYTVHGILPHEFPVKGFYVDRRVCPGFRYKVRYVGRKDDVFDGRGRYLVSVGMGYGKRLTFKGDNLNANDCFFWSDNDEDGYAFSHDVLEKGEKFILYDSNSQPIGDVLIESATEFPQIEEFMETTTKRVKKVVRVRFACVINYHTRFHGSLVDVTNQEIEIVEGIADVIKDRREREARVQCIRDVHLMRAGNCTLWRD